MEHHELPTKLHFIAFPIRHPLLVPIVPLYILYCIVLLYIVFLMKRIYLHNTFMNFHIPICGIVITPHTFPASVSPLRVIFSR